jgi:hypothetical protein
MQCQTVWLDGLSYQNYSLGVRIIRDFNGVDPVTQPRNIVAWTPVVNEVLQGCREFDDESVSYKVAGNTISHYIELRSFSVQ